MSEVEYKVMPYKTIQKYDPNLAKGTTIVTGGENGSTKSITASSEPRKATNL